MPPLGSAEEFERYRAVLEESARFSGCFMWKQPAAVWVGENLDCHKTQKAVERLIYEHRNEIRQREETRPEFRQVYQFFYTLVIHIDGMEVFIETVFEPGATSDQDMIRIVSVHQAT